MKKLLFFLVTLLLSASQVLGQATGKVIADKPTGGSIGLVVDSASVFNIHQTTAGQTITIPSPSRTDLGKTFNIANTGTVGFTLNPGGLTIPATSPPSGVILRWTGSAWSISAQGAGSGGGGSAFAPLAGATIDDSLGNHSISTVQRIAFNSGGDIRLNWSDATLRYAGIFSIDWGSRKAYDFSVGNLVIDWDNCYLSRSASDTSLNWKVNHLVGSWSTSGNFNLKKNNLLRVNIITDTTGNSAFDVTNGWLSYSNSTKINLSTSGLINNFGYIVDDWQNGLLYTGNFSNNQVAITLPTRTMSGHWKLDSLHTTDSLGLVGYAQLLAITPVKGTFSTTGSASTSFTVTLPQTLANSTYIVSLMPTSLLAATGYYITGRSTTQFTINYVTALTGSVTFEYSITK